MVIFKYREKSNSQPFDTCCSMPYGKELDTYKINILEKISVKRAVTVCSLDVALDILKGQLPPEEPGHA